MNLSNQTNSIDLTDLTDLTDAIPSEIFVFDNPDAIKQRVIKEYGLNCKFTEETLKQLKVYPYEQH